MTRMPTAPSSRPVLLLLGAGPGTGAAVARRFGHAGYAVGLVARDHDRLAALVAELAQEGLDVRWAAADLTDPAAVEEAVRTLGAGGIDVLHFNPSVYRETGPLELTAQELLADLHVGTASLLTAVRAARPWLREGARVVATGSVAADRPSARAPSLGVQKAALRNLVLSLDRALAPFGVRAVLVQVNDLIREDGSCPPARVAEAVLEAVRRADEDWTPRVDVGGTP